MNTKTKTTSEAGRAMKKKKNPVAAAQKAAVVKKAVAKPESKIGLAGRGQAVIMCGGLTLEQSLEKIRELPSASVIQAEVLWNTDFSITPKTRKKWRTAASAVLLADLIEELSQDSIIDTREYLAALQNDIGIIRWTKPAAKKKQATQVSTPAPLPSVPTPNAVIIGGRTFTQILQIFGAMPQKTMNSVVATWNEWEDEINRGPNVTRAKLTPEEFTVHMQKVYDGSNGFETVRGFCHYLMHEEGLIDWNKAKLPMPAPVAVEAPEERKIPSKAVIQAAARASKKDSGVHNTSCSQLNKIRTETVAALVMRGADPQKLGLAPQSHHANAICESEAVEAVTVQYINHRMMEVVMILGPLGKSKTYRALSATGDEMWVHPAQIVNVREDVTVGFAEVLEAANDQLHLGRNPTALLYFMKEYNAYLTYGGNVYTAGSRVPLFTADKSVIKDLENQPGVVERLIWDKGSDLCKVLCVESDPVVRKLQVEINFEDRARKLEDVLN